MLYPQLSDSVVTELHPWKKWETYAWNSDHVGIINTPKIDTQVEPNSRQTSFHPASSSPTISLTPPPSSP